MSAWWEFELEELEALREEEEGFLDPLLRLVCRCRGVEEAEIDIWDIPIARITEQYLAYLEEMRRLDMEIAGEHGMMQQRDERYDQQQRESHEEHDLGSFDFE